MRQAVCAIILKDNKVLGVSRRGTNDQWGLPGGKVDFGEDKLDALVREIREETNLNLDKNDFEFVLDRTDGNFVVSSYLYDEEKTNLEPSQGDAGSVDWVSWKDLFDGPFGKYNKAVFRRIYWYDMKTLVWLWLIIVIALSLFVMSYAIGTKI